MEDSNMRTIRMLAAIALLGAALPVSAASVTLTTRDQGWYKDTGVAEAGNWNYLAGHCSADSCSFFNEYRNFFIFDLSRVTGRITSATLYLWMPESGFVSPTGSETYQLFSVETPADEVGARWGVDIFEDLGAGVGYGSYTATEADSYSFVAIALEAAALADLNAAAALFALGGAVTSLDPEENDEVVFANSGWIRGILVVETIPIPGAAWLLGSAALALCCRRRRD
jgi:hypothetical protein